MEDLQSKALLKAGLALKSLKALLSRSFQKDGDYSLPGQPLQLLYCPQR